MEKLITVVVAAAFCCLGANGQQVQRRQNNSPAARTGLVSRVQDLKLDSSLMKRVMPYRVILPLDYNASNKTRRYPAIYLLHGLFGHYDNWTDKTKLTEYSKMYKFIIVTPEGGDGWYTDSETIPDDRYESYIIKELIPEIDKRFHTIADRSDRVIAGLSMGGYGAIKFGLKFPELFSIAGSFSGALDAPLRGQEHKNYRPSIMSVFGDDNSPGRHENDVYTRLDVMSPERLGNLPFFYISCGTEDVVNFQINRELVDLLIRKKIPHEYRHFPGAHTWAVWDDQVQEFLRFVDHKIPKH